MRYSIFYDCYEEIREDDDQEMYTADQAWIDDTDDEDEYNDDYYNE